MDFQRFKQNLIQILIRNLFKTRSQHVCWRVVDVGASSSLFPGNGARKELDCWDDGARKEVVPS
jgi:hypothetical protein